MRSAISERGVMPRGPGERQVWRSLNGHEGESWTQPRRTWSHHLQFPEGRVSNLKEALKRVKANKGSAGVGQSWRTAINYLRWAARRRYTATTERLAESR